MTTTSTQNKVPIQYYHPTVAKYGTPARKGDTFSSCCGTNYRENEKLILNPKGIALYPFKVGKEGKNRVNTVAHVETPDGVITIVTREKW